MTQYLLIKAFGSQAKQLLYVMSRHASPLSSKLESCILNNIVVQLLSAKLTYTVYCCLILASSSSFQDVDLTKKRVIPGLWRRWDIEKTRASLWVEKSFRNKELASNGHQRDNSVGQKSGTSRCQPLWFQEIYKCLYFLRNFCAWNTRRCLEIWKYRIAYLTWMWEHLDYNGPRCCYQ